MSISQGLSRHCSLCFTSILLSFLFNMLVTLLSLITFGCYSPILYFTVACYSSCQQPTLIHFKLAIFIRSKYLYVYIYLFTSIYLYMSFIGVAVVSTIYLFCHPLTKYRGNYDTMRIPWHIYLRQIF